jgi:cell division protease FtsH
MKTIVFWLFILLCLVMLWAIVSRNAGIGKDTEISYSDLYDKVQTGQVLDATIQGNELKGHLKVSPKDEFHTTLPPTFDELSKAMLAAKVNFTIKPEQSNVLLPLLINVGPFVLVLMALLLVAPFWVIFKKAGFQPILSVLMMVPFVNLILLYIFAFREWKSAPAHESHAR